MKGETSSVPTDCSFEDALATVEAVVRDLEGEPIGLNESLERFAQGMEALKHCFTLLDAAERRVEVLTGIDAEGRPVAVPFEEGTESLEAKGAARSQRRTHRTGEAGSVASKSKSSKPSGETASKAISKPKAANDFNDVDEPTGLF